MNKSLKLFIYAILISASVLPVFVYFSQQQVTPTLSLIDPNTQVAQVGSTLTNGLVAHYKFDEGSGTTAGDASGNGRTGVFVGNPTFVTGVVGQALSFNGSSDYITVPSINPSSLSGFTLSFWVKVDSSKVSLPVSWANYRYCKLEADRQIECSVDGSAPTTPIILELGRWYHVGFVSTTNSQTIYIDNISKYSQSENLNISDSGIVTIGAMNNGTNFFGGSIDDVRLYNRALQESEIAELYALGTNVVTTTPTPVVTNGSCGTTNNSCSSGNLQDSADTSSEYLWSCTGINGGSTASCSLPIQNLPVNGVCGSTVNNCISGSFSDTADTLSSYNWSCTGSYGGSTAQCSSPIPTTVGNKVDRLNSSGNIVATFDTIQACLNVAVAGDTCLVGSGTYTGFSTVRNGSINNLITVKGASLGNVIILNSRSYLLHSYHKITGLKFQGQYLEIRNNSASYNLIDGNEFTGSSQSIYMKDEGTNDSTTGPSHNVISNNLFYMPTGDGMVVLLGHDNLVTRNTFRDGNGYDTLRVWGLNQTISDNTFTRIINGASANPPHTNHADIVQAFNGSNSYVARGIIFEGNYIKDSNAQLGNLENDPTNTVLQDWTFRNNVFVRSRIQLNSSIPKMKVYNNTAYAVPAENTSGFRFSNDDRGSSDNGEVYNNIFIGDGGYYSFNINTVGNVADYNIVSNLNGSAKTDVQGNTHGINGGFNPQDIFVNIATDDFRLKSGSLAIDRGTPVASFSDDISSTPRPQGSAWDIGAYEYTGTPVSTPTPAVTPTPTPTPTPIPSLPDTTAPTVSITSPSNNTTISNTVTLSSTVSDPTVQGQTTSGILTVQFKLDNINLGQPLTTAPYSGTWNTQGVSNGSHTLTAVATDVAGNTTTSNPITITIANTIPSTPTPTPTPTSTPTPANPSVPTPTPLNPTPTPRTGGGGGGGSSSSGGGSPVGTFTPTVPQKPLSTLCTPSTTTVTKLAIPTNLINLAYGTRNASVLELQNLLIKAGYLQQGYNTGYYGPLTRDALNKYKLAPQTQTITKPCITTAIATTTSRLPKSYIFSRSLKLGSTGTDVKYLQIFLNDNGYIVSLTGPGSKGNESTYFGPATAKALTKYQEYYAKDILTPSGLMKGTGYFGPSTMRKVNIMIQ